MIDKVPSAPQPTPVARVTGTMGTGGHPLQTFLGRRATISRRGWQTRVGAAAMQHFTLYSSDNQTSKQFSFPRKSDISTRAAVGEGWGVAG